MEQNSFDSENTSTKSSGPASADPTRLFPNGTTWRGQVKGQKLCRDFNNKPQLIVSVELEGRLLNDRAPKGSVVPLEPKMTIETTVRFPVSADDPNAEQQFEIAFKDLEKLGFEGDDISTLEPGNKKHQDFRGRTVFVRPKHGEYNGRPTMFWNLWGVYERDLTDLTKGDLTKNGIAKGFREKVAAMRAERAGGPGGGGRAVVEKPETPF